MNLWSEIESVIDHRVFENGSEYLVKIKGLEAHMWVPEVSVSPQLLNVYKVSSLNDSASCLNVYKSKDCTNNQGVESVLINSDIDESFKYRSSIATTCNDALISVKDISTNKKLTHSALQFDKNFLNEKCKTFFFKYGAIKNCEINGTDVSVLHDKLLDRESDVKNLLEDNFLTKSEHNNMELKIAGDSRDSNSLDSNHPPCDNLSDKIEILNVFSSGNDISPSSKDHNDTRLLLNENSNLFLIEPDPVDKEQSNVQFNSFLLDSDKNLLNIEVNSFLEQQSTTALPIEKVNSFLLENVNDDSNTLSLPVPIMQMESLLPKMDENWLPKWPVTDSLLLPNLDSKQLLSSDILGALSHTSANDATDILNPIAAELPSNHDDRHPNLEVTDDSKTKLEQVKEINGKMINIKEITKKSHEQVFIDVLPYCPRSCIKTERKNEINRVIERSSVKTGRCRMNRIPISSFKSQTLLSNRTFMLRAGGFKGMVKVKAECKLNEEIIRNSEIQKMEREKANSVEIKRKIDVENQRVRKFHETSEEFEMRKHRAAERARLRRANETPQQSEIRKKKDAENQRRRRALETPEESAVRRQKAADRVRIKRANETSDEANMRRKKEAERVRMRRANETSKETDDRRRREAERVRIRRAYKKFKESDKIKTVEVKTEPFECQIFHGSITDMEPCTDKSVVLFDSTTITSNVDV